MSKDDSILILKFKTKKIDKYIYIVLYVQAIENFTDIDWTKWYLSNVNMALWNFTKNFKKSLKIAKKMYIKCYKPEYGIKFININVDFQEINGTIVDSPLVGSPKNIKLIHFRTKYPKVCSNENGPLEIKNLEEIFIYK
tara:strand:+ start:8197 stop:8613 length:417 start_codon:yes stop_codon:yes gene_type:complete